MITINNIKITIMHYMIILTVEYFSILTRFEDLDFDIDKCPQLANCICSKLESLTH